MSRSRGRSTASRDRTFGGKAGIWLSKKKRHHRAVHPANDTNKELEKKRVTPPSATNADSVSSRNKGNIDDQLLGNKTRPIVGWDEERCRPIYKEISSSSPSAEEGQDEVSAVDDATEDTRDDFDLRYESSEDVEEDERSVEVPVLMHSSIINNENKKTRAYGRPRKRTSNTVLSYPNACKPKRQHVSYKKEPVVSTSIMTPFAHRTTFDSATPQTSLDNICDALNSDTKVTPARRPPVPSDIMARNLPVGMTSSLPKETTKKDTLLPIKKSSTKSVSVKRQSHSDVPRSLAELDFHGDNVRQPSSTTSLEAAKAFFERLDSQQRLTLDSSATPSVAQQGNKCGRSRRAISIDSDTLRQEYDHYASVTKATGVEPLSMEQYAVNRSYFFRTGDMYDGFLDG